MLCNVKCTASKVWTAFSGSILCKNVKLTEPPDAEPHVRWCERSAAKAASSSIDLKANLTVQSRCFFIFPINLSYLSGHSSYTPGSEIHNRA